MIVEGGFFRSLWRAISLLVCNPWVLAVGLLWGGFRFADGHLFKTLEPSSPLVINCVEAVLTAGARILFTVYAFALYREVRHEALDAKQAVGESSLLNTSLGFVFGAFLPLVHLVPLILGLITVHRNKQFHIRSAIAIGVGGFFTAVYALVLAGWLVRGNNPIQNVGYGFLTQENPALATQVSLLETHSYHQALDQLKIMTTGSLQPDWTVNCAFAIARWHDNDLDGALDTFYTASQENPTRGEFYFYYGRALLEQGQITSAAKQFQTATQYDSSFTLAKRFSDLADSAYTPSPILSAAFSVIILLILFTVHEYGHAAVAWKLGDPTAKDQGRLTLNPIKHLDPFGSIFLPGILIFQHSEMIFGWAKPVPVNPENFKDPPKDHMRVAFAGLPLICWLQ